uniref:Aminotransferase class I/classII large domain-containing protein n=1 Tax=Corethron hystrix TaxID=216773 RepID=A0A7S1G1N0_9STRA|mmetsp:Transcript_8638/g.18992  ORF Transcript_8638/g.18992 Transcript_8638/m.18992 type:complete len:467 (+) Transcript_8638:121-1521(+)
MMSNAGQNAPLAPKTATSEPTPPQPKNDNSGFGESVIRLMTRLSMQYGAINLSQGFPNEPPPLAARIALAKAVLTGVAEPFSSDEYSSTMTSSLEGQGEENPHTPVENLLREVLLSTSVGVDELNQYSPPMGRLDLRQAIADHYRDIYNYHMDFDSVTVTLGATEACASALRTVGKPGDRVVIFEPYHELYPSQVNIFHMIPSFVTLREDVSSGKWIFDAAELEKELSGAKVLLLNTPHNPTGKVFTFDELSIITNLCVKYDVIIITDEIYEHMTYGKNRGKHIFIPKIFPHVANRTLVCNSIGKSASATGWRLGWCITPPSFTDTFRGVHDQLVVMAPHPMQYATLSYFKLPRSYFSDTLATKYVDRLTKLALCLRKMGFKALDPEGAYYLFANYKQVPKLGELDPWDASMFMIKKVGVACVPGTNFYGSHAAVQNEAQRYLRFAVCRSVKDIDLACKKIDDFFK